MPRVTRRPLAAADIFEIWDYIADDSLLAADRWVIGWMSSSAGVRSFPFGRYVIFYSPLDDGIDVVRVLHGARDIDAVFGDER